MAGILDALKTFKQERESIDDVASLPQTLIMQMAQKGQIPKTDVPMILNRKAEMAQTEANIKALRAQQTQGGVAPTIMEQLMAANAQQEVPQEMTDVGIASNPVPEMRLAGGGIIAFAGGGDTMGSYGFEFDNSDMVPSAVPTNFSDEEKLDYLRKSGKFGLPQAKDLQEGKVTLDQLFTRGYSPSSMSSASVKPNVKPLAPTSAVPPKPNKPIPVVVPTGNNAPKDDYMSSLNQMMKDIQSEREALKGNKQDNVNQSLLAAGLGMMAGTSPYALSNIGAGGMKGAEQYAALQGRDLKSRQGLLKEASELAQAKGIIGQRESEAKRRADTESSRTGMLQKRFEMMDKGNRLKAVQLWEKDASPSFMNALAQQYKGVKNWQKLPEVQKQIADTKTRFINEALGTMDTGVLSADDL
jgi:hypothetical protein